MTLARRRCQSTVSIFTVLALPLYPSDNTLNLPGAESRWDLYVEWPADALTTSEDNLDEDMICPTSSVYPSISSLTGDSSSQASVLGEFHLDASKTFLAHSSFHSQTPSAVLPFPPLPLRRLPPTRIVKRPL